MNWKIGRTGKRHLALLISLLILFIIAPFVLSLRFGVVILNIVGVAVLLSGSYAVSASKRLFIVTGVLALASITINWLVLAFPEPSLIMVGHVCLLVLLLLFSISILANVLRGGKVTADKIYGAICVYLLIGYGWAFGYALIEEISPNSFSGPVATAPFDYLTLVMQLRYFSFVTLTTAGYGDVVPVSAVARTFAMLEAVTGQMYTTILIARLVGLHIADANSSRPSTES